MEITSSLLDNSSLIVCSICVVVIVVPLGDHVLVAHLEVHTSRRLELLAEHNSNFLEILTKTGKGDVVKLLMSIERRQRGKNKLEDVRFSLFEMRTWLFYI